MPNFKFLFWFIFAAIPIGFALLIAWQFGILPLLIRFMVYIKLAVKNYDFIIKLKKFSTDYTDIRNFAFDYNFNYKVIVTDDINQNHRYWIASFESNSDKAFIKYVPMINTFGDEIVKGVHKKYENYKRNKVIEINEWEEKHKRLETYTLEDTCPNCDGKGWYYYEPAPPDYMVEKCSACMGTGKVVVITEYPIILNSEEYIIRNRQWYVFIVYT